MALDIIILKGHIEALELGTEVMIKLGMRISKPYIYRVIQGVQQQNVSPRA
jgi:hypothetical protein